MSGKTDTKMAVELDMDAMMDAIQKSGEYTEQMKGAENWTNEEKKNFVQKVIDEKTASDQVPSPPSVKASKP